MPSPGVCPGSLPFASGPFCSFCLPTLPVNDCSLCGSHLKCHSSTKPPRTPKQDSPLLWHIYCVGFLFAAVTHHQQSDFKQQPFISSQRPWVRSAEGSAGPVLRVSQSQIQGAGQRHPLEAPGARLLLTWVVGRDPSSTSEPEHQASPHPALSLLLSILSSTFFFFYEVQLT